mmetsp:Transcript_88318/g.258138  ORF Transcript_88318/g.258138 Transcript_88318/m.258138 type:complete len:148 (+) Transcript_88318:82-525(+)
MASTAELAATGCAGVLAGAFVFVSAVDTRTLSKIASSGDADTLKKFFPVWWPCGRDCMLPLLLSVAGSHAAAYWASKRPCWLYTGAAAFAIAPYTALVLGEDIKSLMKAGSDEVCVTAQRFCMLHQPRLLVALGTFVASLAALRKGS